MRAAAVTGVQLRPGRDEDAEGFIALIGACWAEYPGCVLDVDGEVPELRALASHFGAKGGALWAAELEGSIIGMVGIAPAGLAEVWELSRFYVAAPYRGTGLAAHLLALAEDHAVARGANRLVLWSDTRFTRSHRFYEKHGWRRTGQTRSLADLSATVEFRFEKAVACGGRILG
ncbi:MAG: GNAT family N-acetyltransferase [Elioraea sp.]|nr:GNAT family N-acetyltransferase [Elioraea sp.]